MTSPTDSAPSTDAAADVAAGPAADPAVDGTAPTTHADIAALTRQRAQNRRNRKLAYLGGIIALLIPIVTLGLPAEARDADSGGVIARQRAESGLGEGTLGDIDPASSSMNLMLLGLRGMAANQLWMEAIDQKEKKQWNELETTTNSIILLQPHFVQVWKFAGWNMAYNVSAEFDADEDRFYWIKKGAKFAKKGTDRNSLSPELFHERGDYIGKKVGRSDEWRQFRRYWINDPDTDRWNGGPDMDLNPDGRDNFLVAKDLYQQANDTMELDGAIPQRKMAEPLFRGYPQRMLFDLADRRQQSGQFDEATRAYWSDAYDEWTQKFGKERFKTASKEVVLETTPEEAIGLAEEQGLTLEMYNEIQDRLGKMANYNYWKIRSNVERTEAMMQARQDMHRGRELLFAEGEDRKLDFDEAERLLKRGLEQMEALIGRDGEDLAGAEADRRDDALAQNAAGLLSDAQKDQFAEETDLMESIIKAQMMYRYLLGIDGRADEAQTVPLQEVWDDNPQLVNELDEQFNRKLGSG